MATKTEQLLAFLQTPNLTDAAIAAEIDRIQISPEEVSALTGVPVQDVLKRMAGNKSYVKQAEDDFIKYLQTPNLTEKQVVDKIRTLGLNSVQVSQLTGIAEQDVAKRLEAQRVADAAAENAAFEARQAAYKAARQNTAAVPVAVGQTAVAAPPIPVPPAIPVPPTIPAPVNTANLDAFTNWLKSTPGLNDQQIAAEMSRLGITNTQVANLTGVSEADVQKRFNATAPFSNATQGFAQNFNNYQSIPIGAQYNPAVTVGGASPYSQIMGQMKPVGNPYAGVVGNLSMGGYDPALYERLAADNTAKAVAKTAAATADPGQISDGLAKGGMVHGGLMFGMNPPGPDDGAVNLDMGEYVIKKSSVDKYGRGLLDMINEGKVPAKKIRSLLD